jgi:hypothetical protein
MAQSQEEFENQPNELETITADYCLVDPSSSPQDDNQQNEKNKYECSSAHSAIT